MKRSIPASWKILALISVALGATIFFVVARRNPTSSPADPSKSSSRLAEEISERERKFTPREGAPAPELLRYRFAAGDVLTHSFEMFRTVVQKSSVDLSALTPHAASAPEPPKTGSVTVEFRLVGNLEIRVYEAAGKEFVLGYRFQNLTCQVGGEATKGLQRVEEVEKAFTSEETVVRMDDRGEVLEIGFPSGMAPQMRNMVRALLCDQQLRLPPDVRTEWEVEEVDMLGRALAAYSVQQGKDGQACRIAKSKKGYRSIQVSSLGRGESSVEKVEGGETASILFDRSRGRITALSLEGRAVLRVSTEFEMESTSTTRFLLERAERASLGRAPQRSLRGRLLPEGTADLVAGMERERWRKRVEQERLSLETIRSSRQALAEAGDSSSEQLHRLFLTLKELIRHDDANVARVRSIFWAPGVRDVAEDQFLLGALGAAGTVAAQECLGDVLGDAGLPPKMRAGSAVAAAMMIEPPTEALEDRLRVAARSESNLEVQGTSLAALGGMAAKIAGFGEEKRAKELVEFVEQSGAARPDAGWKILWIVSLGNTHSREAYAPLERELSNGDGTVAGHAAEALGSLPDSRVEARLAEVLKSNVPVAVAVGAVKGLEERKSPEARKILDELARTDRREEVAKLAAVALKRLPKDEGTDRVPVEFLEK